MPANTCAYCWEDLSGDVPILVPSPTEKLNACSACQRQLIVGGRPSAPKPCPRKGCNDRCGLCGGKRLVAASVWDADMKAQAEAVAKAQADARAVARAKREAKEKADAEAKKAKAEKAEAKARAKAEKAEAKARAKAEKAEAKARGASTVNA